MKLRVGKPRTLLVIAPHPDDETIGAFGLMAHLRSHGVEVRVLIVSDGAGSHRGSQTWPTERLVAERKRETRLAVRRVGVAAGKLTFLSLPDGGLSGMADVVARLVGREVRYAPKPVLLASPATTDDHPDHRTVANAVGAMRAPGVRRLAYPVWPAGVALKSARSLQLSSQQRLAKRRAIKSYRTQMGRIADDPGGFVMTPTQIAAFCRPIETFVTF